MKEIKGKRKRLLSLALVLSMLLGQLTLGVLAAEGDSEALLNGNSYETLADAIGAAKDGDTITLQRSVTLSSAVTVGRDLVLDLNGNTLSGSGNGQITLNMYCSLTIQNGSLSGSGTLLTSDGNLTLSDLSSVGNANFSLKLESGSAALRNCTMNKNSGGEALLTLGYAVDVTIADSDLTVNNGHVAQLSGSGCTLSVERSTLHSSTSAAVWISTSGGGARVVLENGARVSTGSVADVPAIETNNGKVVVDNETVVLISSRYPVTSEEYVEVVGGGSLQPDTNSNNYWVVNICSHVWEKGETIASATCTEDAVYRYRCTECGAEKEEAEAGTALGHSFGDWTVTKEPKCGETGSRSHICTVCEETETQEIPATVHQFVTEWSSDETNHWHVCVNCGQHQDEAAHIENSGEVTQEATATVAGIRTFSCVECGRVLRTEEIPATGGNTGDNTGGNSGGNTGSTPGGSTGVPSVPAGPTGGGNTTGEDLTDPNTPLGEEPGEGEEEDLGDTDTPLVSKPFLFEDVTEGRWYYSPIKYVFDRDLMNGVSETLFNPFQSTSRGMLATVLHRMEGSPSLGEEAQVIQFSDMTKHKWYTDPVLWAASQGIVTGYDTGAFAPNDDVTREQVAAILYRYANYKGMDTSARADLSVFNDAGRVSKYARDPMAWAVGSGIIGGVDTVTLDPKGNASRAQIAVMLMRFDQLLAEDGNKTQPELEAVG